MEDEYFVKEDAGGEKDCYDVFNSFIKDTTPTVAKWPVSGDGATDRTPDTCKAVVYIDGRDHEWMDYILRTHRRYTGPNWMFYLIGPKNVSRNWRSKYEGPMVKVVDLPTRFGDLSDYPRQINDLYRSEFLWDQVIKCEHVLVTQSDALLLRHGIEDFFKYSYVGAPIYPQSHPSNDWRLLYSKALHQHSGHGGNGGLSLRRKSFMLKALKECTLPKENGVYISEDGWYSACLIELGALLPAQAIANRFSTGSKCEVDLPLGVHKLWQNCQAVSCLQAIMESSLYDDIFGRENDANGYCEEGELFYLQRHDDVRRAVEAGGYKSGFEHWQHVGRFQNRLRYKCI